VADQQHGPAELVDDAGQVGGIGGQAAQWVGRGDDAAPLVLEPLDDAVPAGAVGEGPVHQHNRRLGIGSLG
jgi:hypothetical protein